MVVDEVARERVLAYRARVQGLANASGDGRAVLPVGVQDYPPGRTARQALALRGGLPDETTTVLVHSLRGAMHVHDVSDMGLLVSALRIEDARDLLKADIGPFGAEIEDAGVGFGAAMDQAAAVMREVMADGVPRTKGELSKATTPGVDRAVAPWCEGRDVFHVHDALFRYATLQAGLRIEVESPQVTRFALRDGPEPAPPAAEARAELVRRFLHVCGPAAPADFGRWSALTPKAARTWWEAAEPGLRPVAVSGAGAKRWVREDDAGALESAAPVHGLRLLTPYDPLTVLGDRTLLLPDPDRRRAVWRPAGVPGVLLDDGEIAGTWRQKSTAERLVLTVTPFQGRTPTGHGSTAEADAAVLAEHAGRSDAEVRWER